MEREEIFKIMRDQNCIMGGIRQACIKIWAYLKDEKITEKIKKLPDNGVTGIEFLEAVELLMSFSSQQPDTEVEIYNCDCHCVHLDENFCPGELASKGTRIKMCPCYTKEDK